jgi:hypothetical protein
MNNSELKKWIENIEYNLKRLDVAKGNIQHLILVTKKDITYLKRILKKEEAKENEFNRLIKDS